MLKQRANPKYNSDKNREQILSWLKQAKKAINFIALFKQRVNGVTAVETLAKDSQLESRFDLKTN